MTEFHCDGTFGKLTAVFKLEPAQPNLIWDSILNEKCQQLCNESCRAIIRDRFESREVFNQIHTLQEIIHNPRQAVKTIGDQKIILTLKAMPYDDGILKWHRWDFGPFVTLIAEKIFERIPK